MDSILSLEKNYGYIVAVVVSVIAAVLLKYGYDDYESQVPGRAANTNTKGMIMMIIGVLIAVVAWWAAYSYAA